MGSVNFKFQIMLFKSPTILENVIRNFIVEDSMRSLEVTFKSLIPDDVGNVEITDKENLIIF